MAYPNPGLDYAVPLLANRAGVGNRLISMPARLYTHMLSGRAVPRSAIKTKALVGAIVLFVQNLAVSSCRAACSKALQFGAFRAIYDFASC